MFEITIQRSFTATHALRLSDGSREPIHSHDWQLKVTVGSDQLDSIDTVMDFHDLEAIVERVIQPFQNTDLGQVTPFAEGQLNPSAERLSQWLGTQIAGFLPNHTRLNHVEVEEAPGCTALYRP